jgi:hypothetical protein
MNTVYILWIQTTQTIYPKEGEFSWSTWPAPYFSFCLWFWFESNFCPKAHAGNYMQILGPGIIAMTVLVHFYFYRS